MLRGFVILLPLTELLKITDADPSLLQHLSSERPLELLEKQASESDSVTTAVIYLN